MINYFENLQRARKIYARMLTPVCQKWALTRNALDVLLFLHNNPGLDRAADIVSRRGMTKSHVSQSVADLEKRGLLYRREDENDRRTVHLMLSETATQIAKEGVDTQRQYFAALFRGLTREELSAWRAITEKVSDNIDALHRI